MLQKILFSLLITIILATSLASAATGGTESTVVSPPPLPPSISEEETCFSILTEQVQSQYNINLKSVIQDEGNRRKINVSTYEKFRNYRNRNNSNGSYFFDARRNNIGTIISGGEYMRSQFVSFGNNSNFTFPLRTEGQIEQLGDLYPDFKDNIIYTHHILQTGDFVSCAYLKIQPKSGKTLMDLSQENYMTNILNDSGFEMIDNALIRDGKRFLVGKVRVSAVNYAKDPLFAIDLLTVAYDNQSPLFNEYETFPWQVRAMTDPDTYSQGINAVQQAFLHGVHENTCLEITHTSRSDLPIRCGGVYKSLSRETPITVETSFFHRFLGLFSRLIPDASARLDSSEIESEVTIPHGIMVDEGLSLELQRKIDTIQDSNLREYIRIALTPNFEQFIKKREEQGLVLTPFEETFRKCSIPYESRLKLISEWITKIDPINLDTTQIEYPDPKLGDCILPYPDKRHRDKYITGSFLSNQMTARVLQEGTGAIPVPSESEIVLINRDTILQEYALRIQDLQLNGSGSEAEIQAQIQAFEQERDKKIASLGIFTPQDMASFSDKDTGKTKIFVTLAGILLLLSGGGLTYFLIRKRPTK